MDATVSLVLKIMLAVILTMMALVSVIFFAVVISAAFGDRKEKKRQKEMDEDIPCLKCRYFDPESPACLKEDNYANNTSA